MDIGAAWGATLGKHFPAMTLVQVSALIDPNAKVEIATEFGWKRDFKTDDGGAFDGALLWKGTYQVEVSVMDATPGVHGTEAYDGMRFVTTLVFKVTTGLEAPPRPPVTIPKR